MATSLDAFEANEKAKPDHLTVAELHLWLTTADFLKMRENLKRKMGLTPNCLFLF